MTASTTYKIPLLFHGQNSEGSVRSKLCFAGQEQGLTLRAACR